MTTKDLILKALEEVPESALPEILQYLRSQKIAGQTAASSPAEPLPSLEERTWQAYLESERDREAVYRRLAES